MMPIIIPALGVATLVAVNSDVTISDTKIVPETPLFCSAQAAEPECAVQVLAELRRPEARSTAQAGGRAAQRPPAPADIGGAVAVDGATAAVRTRCKISAPILSFVPIYGLFERQSGQPTASEREGRFGASTWIS